MGDDDIILQSENGLSTCYDVRRNHNGNNGNTNGNNNVRIKPIEQDVNNINCNRNNSTSMSNGIMIMKKSNSDNDHHHHRIVDVDVDVMMVQQHEHDDDNVTKDNKRIFKEEICKTIIALVILILSCLWTTTSLAMVHEKVPDREIYKPLPDLFLDNIKAESWALTVSEIFIIILSWTMVILIFFHKERLVVFRRLFLILSLLYVMRSITMYVTVLPISSESYYCSPKLNSTNASIILNRSFQMFLGMGLLINGKHTYCGDYIYSGHTTILVMSYLMIYEYSPSKWYLLHWITWVMSLVGVLMVLISHGHYTVDVLVAYFVTTRTFWTYHTLANNQLLKSNNSNSSSSNNNKYNYISREWWFVFFKYFERNVHPPIFNQYNLPFSFAKKCFS